MDSPYFDNIGCCQAGHARPGAIGRRKSVLHHPTQKTLSPEDPQLNHPKPQSSYTYLGSPDHIVVNELASPEQPSAASIEQHMLKLGYSTSPDHVRKLLRLLQPVDRYFPTISSAVYHCPTLTSDAVAHAAAPIARHLLKNLPIVHTKHNAAEISIPTVGPVSICFGAIVIADFDAPDGADGFTAFPTTYENPEGDTKNNLSEKGTKSEASNSATHAEKSKESLPNDERKAKTVRVIEINLKNGFLRLQPIHFAVRRIKRRKIQRKRAILRMINRPRIKFVSHVCLKLTALTEAVG